MLRKMLLLTAATVSMYASANREDPLAATHSRVSSAPNQVDEVEQVNSQMQDFHHSLLNVVRGLKDEKTALANQVSGLQADIQHLADDAVTKHKLVEMLTGQLETAQREHANALAAAQLSTDAAVKNAVQLKQEEIDQLNVTLNSASVQASELQTQLASLITEKNSLSSELSVIDSLRADLETANNSNRQLTEGDAAKAAKIEQLQLEIGSNTRSLADADQMMTEREAALVAKEAELDKLKQSGSASAEQLAQKQSELDIAQRNLDALTQQATAKEAELDALRSERANQVRDLTGQLQAAQAEHATLQKSVAPYNNFMKKYVDANLTRTPSGVFDDAMQLTETEKALRAAEQRVDDQEISFAQRMREAQETIAALQKQLAGNGAAVTELEQLKQELAGVQQSAQSHSADLVSQLAAKDEALQQALSEHAGVLASMVPVDQFEVEKGRAESLTDQLKVMTDSRNDLQRRVDEFSATLMRMQSAAESNSELFRQLQSQTAQLKAEKEEAERKAIVNANALQQADAARAKQIEDNRAARAAASRDAGVRTKADVDAERRVADEQAKAAAVVIAAKNVNAIGLTALKRAADLIGFKYTIDSSDASSTQASARNLMGALQKFAVGKLGLQSASVLTLEPQGLESAIRTAISDVRTQATGLLGKDTDWNAAFTQDELFQYIERKAIDMGIATTEKLADGSDTALLEVVEGDQLSRKLSALELLAKIKTRMFTKK